MDQTDGSSTVKKGATKHCAYGTCCSDSRYPDRPSMLNVFFIRFPQRKRDLEKCRRWVKACSRQAFDETRVTKDTYICSIHFVGGKGPTDDHPDPLPATATKYDVAKLVKKPRRRIQRRLVLSPVKGMDRNAQGQQQDKQDESPKDVEVAEILLSMHERLDHIHGKENDAVEQHPAKRACVILEENGDLEDIQKQTSIDVGCQSEQPTDPDQVAVRLQSKILQNENKVLKSKIELLESAKTKVASTPPKDQLKLDGKDSLNFDISQVANDEKKSKFYTGLTWMQFMQLWTFLSPAVSHLRYWNRGLGNTSKYRISPQNALLMTLMRMRQGFTSQDLAYRFGVSKSTVSSIVLTWIQFLYTQLIPLKDHMFACRSRIKENMPLSFKKYKNVRCIIDCTEFFSQRPGNFHRQGNLYSSYKNHTTYKVLIAVAPNGAIMFVSDVFEGSISDRDIVVKSGFLKYLQPGDVVMADRGFNIKDVLQEYKVDLIIPPFLGARKCFTPQEEALTKDVAKHRIHVERAIERVKKFRLLQKTIPLCFEPVITQIVFVVCCLVNFQDPLVR